MDRTPFDSVLAAARTNADWAWRELYDGYAPRVLQYLRSQRVAEPDEVLGETFVRVVRALHTFDGDEDAFRGWLFRIAQNAMIDARRRQARTAGAPVVEVAAELLDDRPVPSAAEVAQRREAEQRLYRLLRALPDDQRAVVYMRFVLDLSLQQVAEVLGKGVPAVKMLQQRGLSTLRDRGQALDGEDAVTFRDIASL